VLATLGQHFFRFGLAFAVVSAFMSVAMLVTVGKVPEVLARSSAVASALTGDYIASVGKIITYAGFGLGGLVAVAGLFFRGSATYVQLFQPYVIMVYLALFTIACDGCVTAVSLLIDIYASALGAFGGTAIFAVKTLVLGMVIASISYYTLVKGFGAPAE